MDDKNFVEQSAIYGLYDAVNRCVYIGQAGRGDTSSVYDRLGAYADEAVRSIDVRSGRIVLLLR